MELLRITLLDPGKVEVGVLDGFAFLGEVAVGGV
jgi:hypothetical protein